MTKLLWLLKWILKAAIFFTLFAFALNNQHEVVMHFFFGYQWVAPLVLVVLAVFTLGLLLGCLAMSWTLRQRRSHHAKSPVVDASSQSDGI
jgi:lipopolysaccharide assembly protein A